MCTKTNFSRSCDLMLFDYRTTYRTDFRDGEVLPPQEPTIRPRPKPASKQKQFHLTDTQTVTQYKDPNFPFDLMAVPKEIIRTYCRDKQQPFVSGQFIIPSNRYLRKRQTKSCLCWGFFTWSNLKRRSLEELKSDIAIGRPNANKIMIILFIITDGHINVPGIRFKFCVQSLWAWAPTTVAAWRLTK